ncbi:ATP-dependent zinc protease family protein [Mongoliitalea daihaiensis]|uniref:ATP-dependent zinc protease family protein n=1 Tax=Mongoliitalea daihaiensis TaxID=2782006 RepID=UPI001F407B00|nr:RimK/LysX family protein [Mongoliitalea daihaiensis]UJP65255.1 ATP-dependent zinc protease [Mongoliitalea daihaiensis]
MSEKKIIGRKEKISFPDWGIKSISSKIDTGAYTSSIHCDYSEEREEEGVKVLYFKLLSILDRRYSGKELKATSYTQKRVKNSFGEAEIRYKVSTKVRMFGEEFEAEFTLTDRSKMRNAVLIGRKLIHGRFLVDVSQVHISSPKKNKPTHKQ